MIVAAAIKYRFEERPMDFMVITGVRHCYIIDRVRSGIEDRLLPKLIEQAQGFVDDKDVFYTREEAYEHAVACGQIKDERGFGETYSVRLVSEDLW
jgi:hypothetical protein